ncbi:MAG: hypothetical protein LCH39_01140 [Proteobacteria bacterium]|nr:hypothetical protein [Pseudomonadota bacterium]
MRKLILISTMALILVACGHRPLKAPCEPGDAQPIPNMLVALLPQALAAFVFGNVGANDCGPMRPL